MIHTPHLNPHLFRRLDSLVWAWLLTVPVLVVFAILAGSLPLRLPGGGNGGPFAAGIAPADCSCAGEMVIRSSDGTRPIPMQSSEVELQVTGMLVHGKTTQTFVNPTDRVIEAVYRFPLPERGTVHAMEMRIGSRKIISVVREKVEANRIYQAAKAQGHKAAKLDQERPNLFTTSAANINPGETVVVILEYLQELEWEDGRFRLVYPLTITPRAGPAGPGEAVHAAPGGWTAPHVQLTVRLDAGLPLDEIESRSHSMTSRWEGTNLVMESPGEGLAADRDFILEWAPAGADLPGIASFVEPRKDGRYAMMMVVPPADRSTLALGMPTDTLFILDVSSSMQGASIAAARRSLVTFLRSLNPGDRFRILLFNHETDWLVRDRVYADRSTVDDISNKVGRLQATGGTDIASALAAGLGAMAGDEDDSHRRIIFLTDGAVSNEDQVFREVTSGLGTVRLHVLGIGAAPNRYLMKKIAGFGRGVCSFIPDSREVEQRIQRFLERLSRPVMTDLKLEWPGCEPEMYPSRLPDLHQGQPLYLSARLSDSCSLASAPVLNGRLLEGEIDIPAVPGNGPATGVGTRWARARIDRLMDSRFEGVAEEDVRTRVLDVALEFGLVTRYTSMVAVEEFASSRGDSETCAIRNMPPAGSGADSFLGQGGTARPMFRLVGISLLLLGGAAWFVARMC